MNRPKRIAARVLPLLPLLLGAGGAAAFDIAPRQVVDMPPHVVTALRGEMVDLLASLQRAQVLSAEGKYVEAADFIEATMGTNAMMTRHAGGIMPGMFMPPEMRNFAQGMHRSADDWSRAVRGGDRSKAEAAFAKVVGTCVSCHQGFQLRRLP